MLKVFINNNQLDYDGNFNLIASLGDISDLKAGSQLKTYTLNIPLTDRNKSVLGYVNDISVERNTYSGAWMEYDEVIILRGSILLLGITGEYARLIITAQDWIDQFDGVSLRSVTGLGTFAYSSANVVASWSASYPVIRYPLVDMGKLASGEDGLNADWWYIDFVPWFQVQEIIEAIFGKYTIQSTVNASTKWRNTYISGVRTLADPSFIQNKAFEARVNLTTDEQDSASIPNGGNDDFVVDADPCQLNNEITDEGNDFSTGTDIYTVPADGNYRFKATVEIENTAWGSYGTIDSSQYTLQIRGSGGILVTASCSQSDGSCLTTVTLDTGYVQLDQADTIWLDAYVRCTVSNTSGIARTFTLWLGTGTKLELDWSSVNLMPAAATYDVTEWLPDITQLSFLKGMKQAYNLQFFFDRENGVVYFEPADDMCTSEVKDITSRVIGRPTIDEISSRYKDTQRLKWQPDTQDEALVRYANENSAEVGQYDVALTNPNCEEGLEVIQNNVFAPIAVGDCAMIYQYTGNIPRMWKDWDSNQFNYPQEKMTVYVPRLAEWKGNTASVDWTYESAAKTVLPQIAPIDFEDQYLAYYLKTFYRINLGRLVTVEITSDVHELSEFITVLADDEKEGFRTTYLLTIDGVSLYYVLNKITHNGARAKLELIQKI